MLVDDIIENDEEPTMLTTITEAQLAGVYSFACKNCKRCIPNVFVKGRYELCDLYRIRAELEPSVVLIEASKDTLTNCPFS